jgi:hypothetical protein
MIGRRYERSQPVYLDEVDVGGGTVYVTIGDGGNREGLYDEWQEPAPEWVAFRNGSHYGRGDLLVVNATHLRWQWWPNGQSRPEDEAWIRNPYRGAAGVPEQPGAGPDANAGQGEGESGGQGGSGGQDGSGGGDGALGGGTVALIALGAGVGVATAGWVASRTFKKAEDAEGARSGLLRSRDAPPLSARGSDVQLTAVSPMARHPELRNDADAPEGDFIL